MSQVAVPLPTAKPRVDFRRLLDSINAGGRKTGACTPTLCDRWNKATDDEKRVIEAVLAFEQVTGKRATPENIDLVRARRSKMDKDTGDTRTAKAINGDSL